MFELNCRSGASYLRSDLKRRSRNMTDSGPAMDDELRRIVCDLLYKNELLRMQLGLVQDSEICQA